MSDSNRKRKNDQEKGDDPVDNSSMLEKIQAAILETHKARFNKAAKDAEPKTPRPPVAPPPVKPPGFEAFQNKINAKRKLESFFLTVRAYKHQKMKNENK